MSIQRRWTIALITGTAFSVLVVLAYFLITDRWTQLDNPIASIVAIVAGVLGIGVAYGTERLLRGRPAAKEA
ncbi:MAG TPA: hypothetical protein VIO14_13270 [Dehalococcoidia bacterium]